MTQGEPESCSAVHTVLAGLRLYGGSGPACRPVICKMYLAEFVSLRARNGVSCEWETVVRENLRSQYTIVSHCERENAVRKMFGRAKVRDIATDICNSYLEQGAPYSCQPLSCTRNP